MSQQQQTLELEAYSEKMARWYLHGNSAEREKATRHYEFLAAELLKGRANEQVNIK